MATRFNAFFFASLLITSIKTHANNDRHRSWTPANAVLTTFWASMAVVGNPDIASIIYRYVMLSPMAVITAGTANAMWNVATNPALLSWLKSRASDITFVPL